MSIVTIKAQLRRLFSRSKKDRHRFLSNYLSTNIAAQIFSLRTAEERNWTQTQLSKEAGIAQPRIPVYESPDYGAFSLSTLKKLAYAFDVALLVKFIPFEELADEIAKQSAENVGVPSFRNADALQYATYAASRMQMMSDMPDFVIRYEGGLILGECKFQPPQEKGIQPTSSLEGIYALVSTSQQPPRALPENKLDQTHQQVHA